MPAAPRFETARACEECPRLRPSVSPTLLRWSVPNHAGLALDDGRFGSKGLSFLAGVGSDRFGLVNEFLDYLADRNYSPRTRRSYAFDLLVFTRWLDAEGVDLAAVDVDVRVFYQSAFIAVGCDPTSKAYYARKRSEGKNHHQAVLALARRRVNVLHAIMRAVTGRLPRSNFPGRTWPAPASTPQMLSFQPPYRDRLGAGTVPDCLFGEDPWRSLDTPLASPNGSLRPARDHRSFESRRLNPRASGGPPPAALPMTVLEPARPAPRTAA
jgi:hypothetical protein